MSAAPDIPDRLLAALARAPYVPEYEIDSYIRSHGTADLTDPELLALKCLSRGMGLKASAAAAGKSKYTVMEQLRSARYKLRAKNNTHAACEAIRQGLIP